MDRRISNWLPLPGDRKVSTALRVWQSRRHRANGRETRSVSVEILLRCAVTIEQPTIVAQHGIRDNRSGPYAEFPPEEIPMPSEVGKKRVLLVEDEAIVADTLRQILSSNGYDTHVSYSAEAALNSLSRWTPDLAILDVMLPKMNGIDLALALKERLSGCRILLISGQPSVENLLRDARSKRSWLRDSCQARSSHRDPEYNRGSAQREWQPPLPSGLKTGHVIPPNFEWI